MHTVAAFFENMAQNTTYDAVSGVSDPANTLSSNGRFIFPDNYRMLAAAVMGASIGAARLNAPSLRSVVLPELYPVNVGAALSDNVKIVAPGRFGPRVIKNEEVAVELSHAGAGAEDVFAGLFMAPTFVPAPEGPIFTLLASASPTLTAGTWVNVALTFNQTLPAGEYTVVGLNVICNDAFLARLVFPGGPVFRPGCVVNDTYGQTNPIEPFRYGRMGLYGKFENTAPPTLDILGYVAGAETPVVMLDVIKTR